MGEFENCFNLEEIEKDRKIDRERGRERKRKERDRDRDWDRERMKEKRRKREKVRKGLLSKTLQTRDAAFNNI